MRVLTPDAGLVIASLYNRQVSISSTQKYICFPLWFGPNISQVSGPIVIAHMRDAHYISLDKSCQIPPNHQQWRRHKTEVASAWETIYLRRQRMYTQIIENERQMYS